MAEQQADNQLQYILSDLGTRIRDLEERTSSLKERFFILSQNLIDSREEIQQRVLDIEKQNSQINLELKKISSTLQSFSSEFNNFVRKDEIILIERMLKDFQPLEFIRKKDVEEMIIDLEKRLNPSNFKIKLENTEETQIKPKKRQDIQDIPSQINIKTRKI